LEQFEDTKDVVQRFNVGDLYETVFIGWYDSPKGDVDWRHPTNRAVLAETLSTELGIPCSPYVFYDHGTFAKHLDVAISGDGAIDDAISTTTSRSSIVGVFTPRRKVPTASSKAARKVLEQMGFATAALRPIPNKRGLYELPGQASLPV
jgi:hypothetical protein